MAELTVKLQVLEVEGQGEGLFITINGRQALHEGPRRIGQCIYCAGPCDGVTTECETRVWLERRASSGS